MGGAHLSLSSRAEKQTERQRMNVLCAHTHEATHARGRRRALNFPIWKSPPPNPRPPAPGSDAEQTLPSLSVRALLHSHTRLLVLHLFSSTHHPPCFLSSVLYVNLAFSVASRTGCPFSVVSSTSLNMIVFDILDFICSQSFLPSSSFPFHRPPFCSFLLNSQSCSQCLHPSFL